jgi:hypothetical protein
MRAGTCLFLLGFASTSGCSRGAGSGTTESETESATELAPAVWATCSIGTSVSCALGVPDAYPWKPSTMSVVLTSALGEVRHASQDGSDFPTLAIRPEGFPYRLRFELAPQAIGLSSRTFRMQHTFNSASDAPVNARMPLPIWVIRVTNPDQLGFGFSTTGPAASRSIVPYVADDNATTVSFPLPTLGPTTAIQLFPAPAAASIPGTLLIDGEFPNPSIKVAAELAGSGVYEVRKTGLVRLSSNVDDFTDASAPDADAPDADTPDADAPDADAPDADVSDAAPDGNAADAGTDADTSDASAAAVP